MTEQEQGKTCASEGRSSTGAVIWIGLVASLVLFAFLLRGFDWRKFIEIIGQAKIGFAVMVPVTIAVEQVFRAVKWQELLRPLGHASIGRLFGGIMAGYFTNYFMPVRVSFLVRAWIASRATKAPIPAVLGTVTMGRVVDGLVFAPLVVLAASTVSLSGDDGNVTMRLLWGALASLVLLLTMTGCLFYWARRARRGHGFPARVLAPLPEAWRKRTRGLLAAFAEGLHLPRGAASLSVIFGCALLMKLSGAANLGFAGLALSADIQPLQYLFIMVCLGFAIVVASALKIVGGFVAGAIILLQQFGVDLETATAMALLVSLSTRATVISTGGIALWLERIDVTEIRQMVRTMQRERATEPLDS